MVPPQSSTVEIANVAPALRRDLSFTLQQHGEQTCYLIEDEKNSKFYRIGIPEYTFISLLDGTTSVREAMAHTAALLGKDAFSERDAASICKWLVDCQLAQTEASGEYDRLLSAAEKSASQKRIQKYNPIMVRVPLFKPDRFLTKATRFFGWWVSWPAFFLWLTVVCIAIHQLLTHWNTVKSSQNSILSSGNLVYLLIFWCVLKVFHELSHGIACKKFGGHIREAGLLFIAMAPIPYVDVTSSWRFASKWRRIFVSAAGMYTELFIAAIATLFWIHSDSPLVRQQAYNVMVTASFVTLLFNANPLMRFDGYYMLSDLLELPNLYGMGQQYTRYLGRRYLMGVKAKMPAWPMRKALIVRAYGLAAMIWRVVVCASIFCAAASLFKGAGIVLAFGGLVLWIGIPLFQLTKYLIHGNSMEKPNFSRFAMTASLLALVITGVLCMPEPGGTRAPGIVTYKPLTVVRAPHAGFVREVRVTAGQQVTSSDIVIVLENKELNADLAELRIEQLLSKQRSRVYMKNGDVAAEQVESEMRAAIESEIEERKAQLANSSVIASEEGRVVTRDVESLIGNFVEEGEELLAVGREDQKEIVMAVAQQDVSTFQDATGESIDVFMKSAGAGKLTCKLGTVDPRASHAIEEPALGANNGGPLAVQPVSTEEDRSEFELVDPRFPAKVKLTADQSEALRAGQLATLRLGEARGTLGQFFYRSINNWLERRLRLLRES